MLDELVHLLRRFVAFTNPHQPIAVALWAVHTHAISASDTSPRLAIQSAEPQSGKSRLLEVLELVVRAPIQALDVSAAALFRSIAAGPVTFLHDEIDTVFVKGADEKKVEVRAIFNSGYRRGAVVPRVDRTSRKVELCNVYSPVALAGIGTLPDTIQSRSIVITLRRRRRSEIVEKFRERKVRAEGDHLRGWIETWTGHFSEKLKVLEPELPDELNDRMQDCWEPLLAIADTAGGPWPKLARDAAVALSGERESQDFTLTVQLLADIRTIFDEHTVERIASKVLADRLAEIVDSEWADYHGRPITPTAVARLLRGHAKPKLHRVGGEVFRGYLRADFEDSWSRYLPDTDSPPGAK